mgnify:CR=1 FL=1
MQLVRILPHSGPYNHHVPHVPLRREHGPAGTSTGTATVDLKLPAESTITFGGNVRLRHVEGGLKMEHFDGETSAWVVKTGHSFA